MNKPIISVPLAPEDVESATDEFGPAEEVDTLQWTVGAQLHGLRLDKSLALQVPGFSRSWLQQLILERCVKVNGQCCVKAATRLHVGDLLLAQLRPPAQVSAFLPQAMPLPVLFEDEHLMVIDKPAGLVVHPAAGNWSGTLLNGLLAYHPGAASLPRAGIVHRLDKDTSGLLVVGKTQPVCEALVRQIAARSVHRVYVALVHGVLPDQREQEVRCAIARDPRNRLRMAVRLDGAPGAREALTRVRVLDAGAGVSWVGCKLHTGRTHQIRVHMAWLGHPLVGDSLYGGREQFSLARQALHAHRLAFVHPVRRELVRVTSPLPADMASAMEQSGLHYNLERLWSIDAELLDEP